ncbi:hypothetical protein QAD02_016598 [Eretmocerus hayati]|uniref:Uncharacterized protein n=1 Tax=Eretmocerus hayati TaxID=131215 RepID=A0ACC2PBJ3_9HYME|nr:hypothetical protein QAD02_016598 [Eretmocerus hayati]
MQVENRNIGDVQKLDTIMGQTFNWVAQIEKYDSYAVKTYIFWESPTFWFRDSSGSRHEWRLRCQEEFYMKNNPTTLSLYTQYMSRAVDKKSIFAIKLRISISQYGSTYVCHDDMTDEGSGETWIQDFSKHNFFMLKLTKFVPYSGKFELNVSCTIIALKTSADQKIVGALEKHDVSLKNEYELLFENGQFSDVTFIIENNKLQLHKSILSSRSPVFAAMFNHDFKENISNEVYIDDQPYEIMREFFRFIYAAKVNEIEKYAAELLFLSNKYDVKGLKSLCGQHIADSLRDDNVLECLNLANQHDAKSLKAECFAFILTNAKKIVKLPSFDINKLPDDLRNEFFKVMIEQSRLI